MCVQLPTVGHKLEKEKDRKAGPVILGLTFRFERDSWQGRVCLQMVTTTTTTRSLYIALFSLLNSMRFTKNKERKTTTKNILCH